MPKLTKHLIAIGIAGFFTSQAANAIDCREVRQLTSHYLRLHFSYNTFDDELSTRTLENFIKAWDPGKVYFLKSDIDNFHKKYAKKIDDMISEGNCSAIDEIINIYSKRFAERHKIVPKLIEQKFDFTKDEHMVIDRKTLKWATTSEEINDRWRKRIKFQYMQLKGTIDSDKEIRSKLHKRYKLATKRHNELTSDDLYAIFLNSFSSSLDPHSDYLPPEQLEDFRISTRLSLEGIGAVLRSEDGFTTIQSLVPGGAAAKTGKVEVEDKIIAVAQGNEAPVDVIDMDLREVVKLIRGPRGTEVRLSLVRQEGSAAKKYIVSIIREKIQLQDRAAKSYTYEIEAKEPKGKPKTYKIGVLNLPSFYMDFEGRQAHKVNFRSSSVDMKKEIIKLKKKNIDALIVDLRSNPGGSLDESIKIAGLFYNEGPVVQIKGVDKEPLVSKDEDGTTLYDGPLVVMIDRQSASASEIFAGAIQDYGRGLIIGDTHTFGKGTVQNLSDLPAKLGAIKVTISKFYRPSGGSTQLKGVESDIVLPSLADHVEIGEKHYDYALAWDKIPQAKHQQFNSVKPYITTLKDLSKKRIDKDADFKKIIANIDEYEKNKEKRTRVSLNEKGEKELSEAETADDDDIAPAKDDKGNIIPDLKNDAYLKETLRITTDYVRLLAKQKPVNLAIKRTLPVGVSAVVAADKPKTSSSSAKK
ncbi:MAG: carboxy terminal-processing peptidase [Bdellovibrionota bacterium]